MSSGNGDPRRTDVRIGVYVCWCGSNIAKLVDVESVAAELVELPGVVVARDYKYMCSDPGQDLIARDIEEHRLNRVVVASCSPRMHELTFRRVLENQGVNPYLFEMANIREQCSWVHTDREVATRKATALIAGAIDRVIHHEPLERREVEILAPTLVVGGGMTGMHTALRIADSGYPVFLLERDSQLGGHLRDVDRLGPSLRKTPTILNDVIARVEGHPGILVLKDTQLEEVDGYVGNFGVTVRRAVSDASVSTKLAVGNIVLATGLRRFDAGRIERYGLGRQPQVITSVELERMLTQGSIEGPTGEPPKTVLVINCVGSRSKEFHAYCSRTCCIDSLRFALGVRELLPDTAVYVAYTDMRAFAKRCEELYERAARRGVRFMMFHKADLPRVLTGSGNGHALVRLNERLTREPIELAADLIVLNTGVEPHPDAPALARLAGISVDKDGFFIEKHPKLDPVATTTDGVFIAGRCQGPKSVGDSVAQGSAVAARVLASIMRGRQEVEAISSFVQDELCAGCRTCIGVCPYGAIRFDDEHGVSRVNEVLCKGCGTCASTCPAGAIHARHFTYRQISSQIEGILRKSPSPGPDRVEEKVP